MNTIIYIHSTIGNTPITNRGGNFCDKLAMIETDCNGINDAKELCNFLIDNVKYAYSVSFNIPEHKNQNLRSQQILGSVRF